jgi:N-acetyl sugar amidotransferase
MRNNQKAYYGLPSKVIFCKECIMSNQRPASIPEFRHTPARDGAKYMQIDESGLCDACKFSKHKIKIDWKRREKELLKLLDKHRRHDGAYDCVVPGSGGKDSVYAAHVLKYKYGMHPLTVTWPPILYTDVGYKNFINWIEVGGFDNISFKPNGRVHRLLTRLAIEKLLHPFQPFILGQKNLAPKIALKYRIPLIFYGENEAEYGNPVADNATSLRDKSFYVMSDFSNLWLAGIPVAELMGTYGLKKNDILTYLPADHKELEKSDIQVHYLGYYLKWTPQESYYYAVENTAFEANPVRTEGTYSKYNSLDDKIDGLHYYTTYIKFGLGRTSYEASQEVRNHHITREEAIALARRFDGEFPARYFSEVMDYIGMKPDYFYKLCDRFRSPHLWKKERNEWKLKRTVF